MLMLLMVKIVASSTLMFGINAFRFKEFLLLIFNFTPNPVQ